MKCPICSREQDAGTVFCTACGKKIPRCPACGTVLYERGRFCVTDGTPLPEELFADFPPVHTPSPPPAAAGRTVPPPPPPVKKKRNRLPIVFIIIPLLLLAAAAGGYALFQQGLLFSQEPDRPVSGDSGWNDPDEDEKDDWDDKPEEAPDEGPQANPEKPAEDVPGAEPAGPSAGPAPAPAAAVSMAAVTSVDASSYLSESQYNLYHTPDRVIDGDLSTAWVEGSSGNGVDESITITFDGIYLVSGMYIYAGYQKSEELYEKNARPASFTVIFSNGESQTVILQDVNGPQDIVFTAPVETGSITLVISSVYSGSKYEDTAISELSFY